MRKYNISTERSEKIMDILSKLNIISMKDYYSAIVTITKEEWDKIEEIFDKITEWSVRIIINTKDKGR